MKNERILVVEDEAADECQVHHDYGGLYDSDRADGLSCQGEGREPTH